DERRRSGNDNAVCRNGSAGRKKGYIYRAFGHRPSLPTRGPPALTPAGTLYNATSSPYSCPWRCATRFHASPNMLPLPALLGRIGFSGMLFRRHYNLRTITDAASTNTAYIPSPTNCKTDGDGKTDHHRANALAVASSTNIRDRAIMARWDSAPRPSISACMP